jgi:hypothetical protein
MSDFTYGAQGFVRAPWSMAEPGRITPPSGNFFRHVGTTCARTAGEAIRVGAPPATLDVHRPVLSDSFAPGPGKTTVLNLSGSTTTRRSVIALRSYCILGGIGPVFSRATKYDAATAQE